MTVFSGAPRAPCHGAVSPHAARRSGRLRGVKHGFALRAMSLRDGITFSDNDNLHQAMQFFVKISFDNTVISLAMSLFSSSYTRAVRIRSSLSSKFISIRLLSFSCVSMILTRSDNSTSAKLFFNFASILSALLLVIFRFHVSDELIFSRSRYILLFFLLILRDIHAIIRPKLRFMK